MVINQAIEYICCRFTAFDHRAAVAPGCRVGIIVLQAIAHIWPSMPWWKIDSTSSDVMPFLLVKKNVGKKEGHIPGDDDALWSFIIGDMIVFAMFFCIYISHRMQSLELYHTAQATLDIRYGVINTLLLLTSSLFVAGSVTAFRQRNVVVCRRLMGWGFLCGLGFSIAKIFEYYGKANAGITPLSNEFFTFYYVLTGIHLVHLLVGISVLGYGYIKLHLSGLDSMSAQEIESGASYWHMVDLLWIVIFPLLYMLP